MHHSRINYNNTEQYYSKEMKDTGFFDAKMILDLQDTSNPYTNIHSSLYEYDLVSYLRNWKVSVFIENCFRIRNDSMTQTATETVTEDDETNLDLTPSFGRFYLY